MGWLTGQENSQQALIRFATKISKELSRGKPPSFTEEMKTFFSKNPQGVLDVLLLLVEHYEEHNKVNDDLETAFFVVMAQQLEEIRYAVDVKFEWAERLVEDFQIAVAKIANDGLLPPTAVKAIMDTIFSAKLTVAPFLVEALDRMMERTSVDGAIYRREEFLKVIGEFVREHKNDPFSISVGISELIRYMPNEVQSAVIGEFFNTNLQGVKDAVAILTLNPDALIRKEALQWLLVNSNSVTQTGLRRLIVIRNWILDAEKQILDRVTRAVRLKGVECAQWEPGEKVFKIQSSHIDGAGAQGLMLVTKPKSKFRLSSVLVKQGVGIADAWSTPTITQRELSETFSMTPDITDISIRYLDTIICHNIQVSLDVGSPPQIGLLQVAERMGATTWLAKRIDFQELLVEIIEEAHGGNFQLNSVADIIQSSAIWGELPGISDSWFEESQSVVRFIRTTKTRRGPQRTQKVLVDFCEPNRQTWAEKFAMMAFWYCEQPTRDGKKNPLAYNFAVLARELYTGRSMTGLPMMELIAKRTVESVG